MASRKPMTQAQFEARCQQIRRAAGGGFRVPRGHSPAQTSIAADRVVYEFIRAHADRRNVSMKAALTEVLRPLMEAGA
jgi:hypothetical protein